MCPVWNHVNLAVYAEPDIACQARALLDFYERGVFTELELRGHLAWVLEGYGRPTLESVVRLQGDAANLTWTVVGITDREGEGCKIDLSGPGPCRGMQTVTLDEFVKDWVIVK